MATYNEVLAALDFNDTTVAQLQLEGLGTADGLRIMTYEDLTYLSRTVMRNDPPVGTYFSIVSVKLLKAFKYSTLAPKLYWSLFCRFFVP